jgi:hypothetical protein
MFSIRSLANGCAANGWAIPPRDRIATAPTIKTANIRINIMVRRDVKKNEKLQNRTAQVQNEKLRQSKSQMRRPRITSIEWIGDFCIHFCYDSI